MINLKDIVITPDMLNQIAELDWFAGAWMEGYQSKLPQKDLQTMKDETRINSIEVASYISGGTISDNGIKSILNHDKNKSTLVLSEEWRVKGYDELLYTICSNYKTIPLSENYLKKLNQILFQFSDQYSKNGGEYKDPSVNEQMKELIDWAERTLNDKFFHPIIVIGIFVVHFWSINPFKDGNFRLLMALIVLLMMQNNYVYMQYYSLEMIIKENIHYFLRIIEDAKKTIEIGAPEYTHWLLFFTDILIQHKDRINDIISKQIRINKLKLSDTSYKILGAFTSEHSCLGMKMIIRRVGLNKDTVRKAVRVLIKKGLLTKIGSTNHAIYYKNV